MTKPGDQPPSNFDARADNAALALRKNLQRQGREVPDRAPVEVGSDGKPPAPPPPQGSYARQALELQQQREQRSLIGDQPPAGTAEQAMDGSMAPRLDRQDPAPPRQETETTSPRAEQRIQELVAQLRQKDQDLQVALEQGKKATETATQFESRLSSLQTQHQQMLQANLDNLDPDTRAQVMQDARMSQRLDEFQAQILNKIHPQLQALETQAARTEMQKLADKYPGFDYQIHSPLIDMFRGKNPHCSIEQAFRAIAQPEEVITRPTARAQAVPPIVPPGNGELAAARYSSRPEQQQQRPEDELVEESRRIAALRRDTDPAKQKEGMRLLDEHLKRRLSGR